MRVVQASGGPSPAAPTLNTPTPTKSPKLRVVVVVVVLGVKAVGCALGSWQHLGAKDAFLALS